MNIEYLREYCMTKKGVSETFPFDKNTLVFKVLDKMFALTNLENDFRINLKCEPEKAINLREKYTAVLPGYHMHKKHWNTIIIDGSISDEKIKKWIDESYFLVVDKMTKKNKKLLSEM